MSDVAAIDWLARARAGDTAALGELLASYGPYLSFLAGLQIDRRLQGKADAADLVQETYLEAHRHFAQFRGQCEAEFSAWLRSILAGLVANHLRRHLGTKRRDARLERALAVELDDTSCLLDRGILDQGSSPSHQAARRESGVLLAEALERLPADYRTTIVLRNFEGLSFPEIAARLGRSVDSVQKLWVRALTQLRQGLVIEPP